MLPWTWNQQVIAYQWTYAKYHSGGRFPNSILNFSKVTHITSKTDTSLRLYIKTYHMCEWQNIWTDLQWFGPVLENFHLRKCILKPYKMLCNDQIWVSYVSNYDCCLVRHDIVLLANVYWRFRWTCCIHLCFSTLNMESVRSSYTVLNIYMVSHSKSLKSSSCNYISLYHQASSNKQDYERFQCNRHYMSTILNEHSKSLHPRNERTWVTFNMLTTANRMLMRYKWIPQYLV